MIGCETKLKCDCNVAAADECEAEVIQSRNFFGSNFNDGVGQVEGCDFFAHGELPRVKLKWLILDCKKLSTKLADNGEYFAKHLTCNVIFKRKA